MCEFLMAFSRRRRAQRRAQATSISHAGAHRRTLDDSKSSQNGRLGAALSQCHAEARSLPLTKAETRPHCSSKRRCIMFRPITLSRYETRRLWVGGVLFAGIILLILLKSAAGAMERVPQSLPNLDTRVATPLPGLLVNPQDQTLLVWDALTALHENDYEAAIAMWERVLLRDDTEVWRQIALGNTHLALGNIEEATECLKLAAELRPENPVVNYYMGILRLEQARYAPDFYDAMGIDVIRLAAYTPNDRYMPDDVVPNSRSMYRMLARVELEKAVGLAAQVNLDEPLTPDYGGYATVRPTVRELLIAMDVANFPARATTCSARCALKMVRSTRPSCTSTRRTTPGCSSATATSTS